MLLSEEQSKLWGKIMLVYTFDCAYL